MQHIDMISNSKRSSDKRLVLSKLRRRRCYESGRKGI
jgi:ribosomal protein S21